MDISVEVSVHTENTSDNFNTERDALDFDSTADAIESALIESIRRVRLAYKTNPALGERR